MTGLVLFGIALLCLFLGYSVAFTFAGVSVLIGVIVLGADLFAFMPYRIMSIMENTFKIINIISTLHRWPTPSINLPSNLTTEFIINL